MNTIKAKIDQSDYEIYGDFMNIQIDGQWLDEMLDEAYPANFYRGLIPTLLYAMEMKEERELVWNRIKPEKFSTTICPILMCPDDCGFTDTIIVAEIEQTEEHIIWKRMGMNEKIPNVAEEIGNHIQWLEEISPLRFSLYDYDSMIIDFMDQYSKDEEKYTQTQKNHSNSFKNRN